VDCFALVTNDDIDLAAQNDQTIQCRSGAERFSLMTDDDVDLTAQNDQKIQFVFGAESECKGIVHFDFKWTPNWRCKESSIHN
jgi:hypothetical protein